MRGTGTYHVAQAPAAAVSSSGLGELQKPEERLAAEAGGGCLVRETLEKDGKWRFNVV